MQICDIIKSKVIVKSMSKNDNNEIEWNEEIIKYIEYKAKRTNELRERIKKEQEDWEFYPVFLRDNLEKLCKEEVSKKKEKDENDADRKLIKLFNNKYYYNKGYSDGTHDAIKILATALNYTEKELNQILSEHKK